MNLIDYLVASADAYVSPAEERDGRYTFIAANKTGRQALQSLFDSRHPGKVAPINWRDAGEGWPDTWLGISLRTDEDRSLAAALSAHGARVLHRDDEGVTELREGKVASPATKRP
jgi:hypothetical protein